MTDFLFFIGLLLIFFVLFFGNYAAFAWMILRWVKKPVKRKSKGKVIMVQPKISAGERIKCCIPVWQAVEVRKAMYGSSGVFAPIAIVALVFMVTNCIISWFIPINAMVMFVAHILFYIGFLASWIMYGIITADCARLYDFGKLTIVLNFLLPHLFCFYIKNNVPHIMLDMRKEKTFEQSSDTVIKYKHSK